MLKRRERGAVTMMLLVLNGLLQVRMLNETMQSHQPQKT